MKTTFKITLPVLVMIASLCRAQALEMKKGEPFPFSGGLAMSNSTVDSSRTFVAQIKAELVNEKAKNLDLAMKLKTKTFEHSNQTVGYQGLQQSFESLSEKSKNYPKVKRRRFWAGVAVGGVSASLINYVKNRKP